MGPIRKCLVVIERSPSIVDICRTSLSDGDLEILSVSTEDEGLELCLRVHPQIVIIDVPVLNGEFDFLSQLLSADPGLAVILLTDQYSTAAALSAIRLGATDFLKKPIDTAKLLGRVRELLNDAEHRSDALSLERELIENYQFEGIIGKSPVMLEVFSRIRRVAPHFRVLLLRGETGTGKELAARAIHRRSPAAKKSFVACNCSGFVETLLETELFGYVKGAFTGASSDKVGLFEYASGGTLFLDEIGEMPLGAQAKLLRVLQNEEIQRVGSPKVHTIDTRVITATNRDLRSMVAEGQFREDLYYRIAVVELSLPVLSQRMEDLPLLIRYFLEKYSKQYKKEIAGLTRRAQSCLAAYAWPGNIRELEHVIANACMMTETQLIDFKDLPDSIVEAQALEPSAASVPVTMETVQENHLLRVLAYTSGNKAWAAEILGISRETVYTMLARISQRPPRQQVRIQEISEEKRNQITITDRPRRRKL